MTPGWYPDPMRRYEHRYFNGSHWTADVATNGQRFVDTLPPPGAPAGPPGPALAGPPGGGRSGLAVAGLVLGIIGAGGGWIPFLAFLAVVAAVLAIVFGVMARRRARPAGQSTGMATTAIVLGVIGVAASVVGMVLSVWVFRVIDRYERPGANATTLDGCDATSGRVIARGTLENRRDETSSFTVRVELGHDGSAREQLAELDDVAPGAVVSWDASAFVSGSGEPRCRIVAVHGPLPFGIDPEG